MKLRLILPLIIMLHLTVNRAYSQTYYISYKFDKTGNRIEREKVKSTILMSEEEDIAAPMEESEREIAQSLIDYRLHITANETLDEVCIEISNYDSGCIGTVTIYSSNGVLIQENPIEKARTMLDLSAQPKGIYLMRITIGSETTTRKLIKS